MAPLHFFYLLVSGFPVLPHCCFYYFHGTHLDPHRSLILLDYRVGTLNGEDEDEVSSISLDLFVWQLKTYFRIVMNAIQCHYGFAVIPALSANVVADLFT